MNRQTPTNTNLNVHFSSATPEWETPQELFDELNHEWGPFTLDVCATSENKKAETFFDKDTDGLKQDWHTHRRCWMNPPYGKEIKAWVKKAYEESLKGATVVCLLPSRTDTTWFHNYCTKALHIRFLRGRLKFSGHKNSAPFPSVIVVFAPTTTQNPYHLEPHRTPDPRQLAFEDI